MSRFNVMPRTLPDQDGNPIDVTGFEPIAGQYPSPKPQPHKRDLYTLALDFEWHTSIPLAAAVATLAIIISVAAIVITVATR